MTFSRRHLYLLESFRSALLDHKLQETPGALQRSSLVILDKSLKTTSKSRLQVAWSGCRLIRRYGGDCAICVGGPIGYRQVYEPIGLSCSQRFVVEPIIMKACTARSQIGNTPKIGSLPQDSI